MHLPALLADFQPISPGFQVDVYSITLLLTAIGGLLIGIAGLWIGGRRKPPLDSHLVKLELAIEGLEKSVDKLSAAQDRQAGHESEIDGLKEKLRALELRVENDASTQRRHIAHVTREIGEKIDSNARIMETKFETLSLTINSEFKSLYRALGKTEGILEAEKS